jgi:hypothetical protein
LHPNNAATNLNDPNGISAFIMLHITKNSIIAIDDSAPIPIEVAIQREISQKSVEN